MHTQSSDSGSPRTYFENLRISWHTHTHTHTRTRAPHPASRAQPLCICLRAACAPPCAQPGARWAPEQKRQREELGFAPRDLDSFGDLLGWVSAACCEPGVFAQTRKQGCCYEERVSKGTRLRGALWPKMGQCERQTNKQKTTRDGLKNMKYFKIHEVIMISFIFQRPHGSSLDEAREPIHYFEKWLKNRERKRESSLSCINRPSR